MQGYRTEARNATAFRGPETARRRTTWVQKKICLRASASQIADTSASVAGRGERSGFEAQRNEGTLSAELEYVRCCLHSFRSF